jgi:hypothetical protein
MPKKAFVPLRIAPLQRVRGVPITDPAEQAALDKMRQRLKQKRNRHGPKTSNSAATKRK